MGNVLGTTPVREQGKQDWTEGMSQQEVSAAPLGSSGAGMGFQSWHELRQMDWAFIRTLFTSSTRNQLLHIGYTQGGCVTFAETATMGRDPAVSHHQPTLLVAGEMSALGIKRRSRCGTRFSSIPPFLIFSGFY